jgi:hypothetical protein
MRSYLCPQMRENVVHTVNFTEEQQGRDFGCQDRKGLYSIVVLK